MIQSDTVKIAFKWKHILSINVSYSCYQQSAFLNLLELALLAHYG